RHRLEAAAPQEARHRNALVKMLVLVPFLELGLAPARTIVPDRQDAGCADFSLGHRSSALDALGVDIERIDRVTRRHEQPIALDAAEAEVGAAFRERNKADWLAGRIENLDAVLLLVAHTPAAPQVAVD